MELQTVLLFLIYLFSFSITTIVLWSFLRRWIHKRKYARIDQFKSLYQVWIEETLNGNSQYIIEFQRIVKEDSAGREALEQLVCERCVLNDKLIFPLIKEVGFVQLYEKKLVSNRLSTALRAYAADRLGRMRSEESVDALCQVLNEKHGNEELTDSILKAMALIGSAKALNCIVTAFPLILSKELITPKNGEMILLMFAPLHHEALVTALRNFYQADERLCTIVMLDALSRSEVTLDMVTVAREILNTQDVELRVRSLRLIANAGANMVAVSLPEIKDYLHDEYWFVRVQAIEATRRFMNKESFSQMIPLLGDAHWQVRRAAAGAIVSHGDEGLETIIEVIESKDVYAKEAICEAIHLEGYVEQLVRHLTQSSLLYNSSARILFYMMSIGLDSGLKEMALSYPNDEIRQNLHLLMYPEGSEND